MIKVLVKFRNNIKMSHFMVVRTIKVIKSKPVFSLVQNANVRSQICLHQLIRHRATVVGSKPGKVAVPAKTLHVSHAGGHVVQNGVMTPVVAALEWNVDKNVFE